MGGGQSRGCAEPAVLFVCVVMVVGVCARGGHGGLAGGDVRSVAPGGLRIPLRLGRGGPSLPHPAPHPAIYPATAPTLTPDCSRGNHVRAGWAAALGDAQSAPGVRPPALRDRSIGRPATAALAMAQRRRRPGLAGPGQARPAFAACLAAGAAGVLLVRVVSVMKRLTSRLDASTC